MRITRNQKQALIDNLQLESMSWLSRDRFDSTLTMSQSLNEPANFAPNMPSSPMIFEHGSNDV